VPRTKTATAKGRPHARCLQAAHRRSGRDRAEDAKVHHDDRSRHLRATSHSVNSGGASAAIQHEAGKRAPDDKSDDEDRALGAQAAKMAATACCGRAG